MTRSNAASGGESTQAALGERGEPARVADAVGHGSSGRTQPTSRRRRRVAGSSNAVTSIADDVARRRARASSVAQLGPSLSPPGAGNCAGIIGRVEHVEVEVDEDPLAAHRGRDRRGARSATPARSSSLALAGVEVAHADSTTRAGSSAGAKPASQRPHARRQAHAAEEAARRRRRAC